jgi:hypothetical protein
VYNVLRGLHPERGVLLFEKTVERLLATCDWEILRAEVAVCIVARPVERVERCRFAGYGDRKAMRVKDLQ